MTDTSTNISTNISTSTSTNISTNISTLTDKLNKLSVDDTDNSDHALNTLNTLKLTYDLSVSRSPLPYIPVDWSPESQIGIHVRTYSAFPSDEASSAAQKAVRRGYTLEAIQWFLELFWSSPHRRTNIWNRALVMAVEDIGPADPLMICQILNLRKNKDDALSIATAAYLLARSEKSRVNDWSIHLYMLNKNYGKCSYNVASLKSALLQALANKNVAHALYWAGQLILSEEKITHMPKVVDVKRYNKAEFLIWETLLEYEYCERIKNTIDSEPRNNYLSPYIVTLMNLAFETNWKWDEKSYLLISHIIHLICYDKIPNDLSKALTTPTTPTTKLTDIVTKIRNREILFGIPDYALDKHTASGKRMGRGLTHFVTEASKLNNRHSKWEALDNFYIDSLYNTDTNTVTVIVE